MKKQIMLLVAFCCLLLVIGCPIVKEKRTKSSKSTGNAQVALTNAADELLANVENSLVGSGVLPFDSFHEKVIIQGFTNNSKIFYVMMFYPEGGGKIHRLHRGRFQIDSQKEKLPAILFLGKKRNFLGILDLGNGLKVLPLINLNKNYIDLGNISLDKGVAVPALNPIGQTISLSVEEKTALAHAGAVFFAGFTPMQKISEIQAGGFCRISLATVLEYQSKTPVVKKQQVIVHATGSTALEMKAQKEIFLRTTDCKIPVVKTIEGNYKQRLYYFKPFLRSNLNRVIIESNGKKNWMHFTVVENLEHYGRQLAHIQPSFDIKDNRLKKISWKMKNIRNSTLYRSITVKLVGLSKTKIISLDQSSMDRNGISIDDVDWSSCKRVEFEFRDLFENQVKSIFYKSYGEE